MLLLLSLLSSLLLLVVVVVVVVVVLVVGHRRDDQQRAAQEHPCSAGREHTARALSSAVRRRRSRSGEFRTTCLCIDRHIVIYHL